MPTYEYECKSCGHSFDIFQNMSDEPLKICPQCGNEIRRIINGGTGIIFKGSGFYVTDKKGGGGTRTDSSPKAAPKTPAPESSGKAESAGSSPQQNSSPPGNGSEKKAAG
jgi:putative FmdB family regulatory protein